METEKIEKKIKLENDSELYIYKVQEWSDPQERTVGIFSTSEEADRFLLFVISNQKSSYDFVEKEYYGTKKYWKSKTLDSELWVKKERVLKKMEDHHLYIHQNPIEKDSKKIE
jgi:hypothetical protein